jgi:hypothetical protein|tara:strand:+ start:143 stop:667 length:525 start_codon:yes stop_codon:yes gene_type:complete
MKIDTEITSQMLVDYTFLTGKSNINCDYFIDKIEEGIRDENNKSFQTNVQAYMTPWKYFSRDQEFLNFLYPVMNKIDSLPTKPPSYFLDEAWGIKEMLGHRSSIHDHMPSYLSGVLYLNSHPQLLKFPQINKTVKPQPGRFVIFSSFLKHGADRNLIWDSKYAVSFNLHYQLPY